MSVIKEALEKMKTLEGIVNKLQEEHTGIKTELTSLNGEITKINQMISDMKTKFSENVLNKLNEREKNILLEVDSRIKSMLAAEKVTWIGEINEKIEEMKKDIKTGLTNRLFEEGNEMLNKLMKSDIMKVLNDFKEWKDHIEHTLKEYHDDITRLKGEHITGTHHAATGEIEEDDSYRMHEVDSDLKPRLLALQQCLSIVSGALHDFQSGRIR